MFLLSFPFSIDFVKFLKISSLCPFSSVRIDSDEGFLRGGEWPVLTVLSAGHALHVFINDQLTGVQLFYNFC